MKPKGCTVVQKAAKSEKTLKKMLTGMGKAAKSEKTTKKDAIRCEKGS